MITPFGELPNRLATDMSLAEQHDWLAARLSRRTLLKAGAAGAAGLALPGFWRQPAQARSIAIFGRHISYGADPVTEMTVSFATRHRLPGPACGKPCQRQAMSFRGGIRTGRPGTSTPLRRTTLGGLESDTSYAYSIIVDSAQAGEGSFRTAARGAHKFRFTAFGDQGTGAAAVALLPQIRNLAPRLHLYTGDLSYADSTGLGGPGDVLRPKLWDTWLQQNDRYSGEIPWMFAMGNHEMEPGFDMHGYAGVLARVSVGGTSPLAIPTACQYRVGSVGFVALDSNDVSYEIPANRGWTQGAQTSWFAQTLSQMRAAGSGIDFIVVYMHHPAYSTSSNHRSEHGVREQWVPLIDRYGVDLVISGHAHCFERTLPLRGESITQDDTTRVRGDLGTTYVTAGGGGQLANITFRAAPVAKVLTVRRARESARPGHCRARPAITPCSAWT